MTAAWTRTTAISRIRAGILWPPSSRSITDGQAAAHWEFETRRQAIDVFLPQRFSNSARLIASLILHSTSCGNRRMPARCGNGPQQRNDLASTSEQRRTRLLCDVGNRAPDVCPTQTLRPHL